VINYFPAESVLEHTLVVTARRREILRFLNKYAVSRHIVDFGDTIL